VQWLALEKLANLHDGYRRAVMVDGRRLLLLQAAGRHYLIGARCPHYDQPLDKATISGGVITCPMHGYRFDLDSGSGTDAAGERVSCRLPCYALDYRGNEVGLWR